MAITDLQISDTIEAGAPSIKYGEGDVQRQVPENNQERVIAQQIWESLDPAQQSQFITFEQFYTSGAWKEILARMQQQQAQQEQPMAYGGIAGLGGRRRYGLGSRLRKLIPNEVAQVAEVAAPFVAMAAPQFALHAALAGGLGSYDRTGNLMSGLKSGAMTYGLGALSPGMERFRGVGPQSGIFTTQPFGGKFNLANVLKSRNVGALEAGAGMGDTPAGMSMNPITGEYLKPTEARALAAKYPNKVAEYIAQNTAPGITGKSMEAFDAAKNIGLGDTSGIMDFIDKNAKYILLGSMGIAAATAKPQDVQEAVRVSRGTGMDIDAIRKEVQDALASGEEAWNALREKYPYLGEYPTKGRAEGGRIGYQGGGSSDPILIEEYKKYVFEMEEMGLTPMSFEQFIAQARAGQAQGGRIGYQDGKLALGEGFNSEELNRMALDMFGKELRLLNRDELEQLRDEYEIKKGRVEAQEGGIMDLGGMEKDYRNEGGFVPIGEYEKKDDVPARLSKNEFVFTADAVRGAGGGDIDKGAEIMENIMKNLEQGGKISEETQGLGGAQEMFSVSERLSEVV